RCGVDADWLPVLSVLDQLRTDAVTTNDDANETPDVSDDAESLTTSPPEFSPVTESAVDLEPVKRAKRRGGALPNWSNYWQAEAPESEQPVAAPRLILEDEHRVRQMEITDIESPPDFEKAPLAERMHDPEVREEFRELESWKQERQERLDRLLKIVAEREAAAEAARVAAQTESPPVAITEEGSTTETETSSPVSPQEDTPKATPVKRRTMAPGAWDETLSRWRRSLPHPLTVLTLLLVPLGAWWFWPSSDTAIAETYSSMYAKLRSLRDRPGDRSGMEEFVTTSQAELDKLIPKLKQRATPKDPDSQLLLWIGRDCLRPMLKSPRTRNTKHEAMLKKLLAQWNESHHITPTDSTEESSAKAAIEEPLRSSPSAVKGLGFGSAAEPEDKVEAELPTTSPPEKPQKQRDDDKNPN
ncbi:MAG: hypothetical protein FD138_1293, partial [Planctomycetota bacterium]